MPEEIIINVITGLFVSFTVFLIYYGYKLETNLLMKVIASSLSLILVTTPIPLLKVQNQFLSLFDIISNGAWGYLFMCVFYMLAITTLLFKRKLLTKLSGVFIFLGIIFGWIGGFQLGDGPVNIALKTNRGIVVIWLIVYYITPMIVLAHYGIYWDKRYKSIKQ